MKCKIIIVAAGDLGTSIVTAAEIARIASGEILAFTTTAEVVFNSKNYKGNPFDKPPIKINRIPILENEPNPIQKRHFDEPKSKYINKPIRNYRR